MSSGKLPQEETLPHNESIMSESVLDSFGLFLKNNREKVIRLFLMAVIIILVSYEFSTRGFSSLQKFIQTHRQFSVLISLAIYAVLGATPIPSEPLTIFIASLDGPIYALLMATVGNTLAALVEFYIGGNIGNLADFEEKKSRLPFHLGDLPIDSPYLLLLGRMLPGFGPKFISIICGVYHISMFTYVWTTLVSNLLGAAIVAYGGYGLINLL